MVTATHGSESSHQRVSRNVMLKRICIIAVQLCSLIIAPTVLFLCALAAFLTIYGGHHYAIMGQNPYCNGVQEQRYSKVGTDRWTDATKAPRMFIHISDLHVNDLNAPGARLAKKHLELFLQNGLNLWKNSAEAVVVTGDLVNGVVWPPKPLGKRGLQQINEWKWLATFASKVNQSTPWFAVPGNHDTFGGHINEIPQLSQFSSALTINPEERKHGKRIRHIELDRDGQRLHLIALDCTLPVPINRPLNFFGDAEIASFQLSHILKEIGENSTQSTIVFSHYPSAVMKHGLRIHGFTDHISRKGLRQPRFDAYLSGHLHSAAGLAKNGLTSIAKTGAFELEIPDMIETGTFRVFVIDNGFLSFKDFTVTQSYNKNPLDKIIITNPPRAGFCSVGAGFASTSSTHVRFLISNSEQLIEKLEVRIDEKSLGYAEKLNPTCAGTTTLDKSCLHVYGVPWKPTEYASGIHVLSIHSGDYASQDYLFSLDGSQEQSLQARIRLFTSVLFGLSDFPKIAELLWRFGLFLCLLFIVPDLVRKRPVSLALFILILIHWITPFYIVAHNFLQTTSSWGASGLTGTFFWKRHFEAGVDIPYLMSVGSIWNAILPICFLLRMSRTLLFPQKNSCLTIAILLPIYLYPCFHWCLNIWGAHHFSGAVLSISAFPTFLVCLWAIVSICNPN